MVLAGMSYQHGANVHALNLVRSYLFFITLGIYIIFTRTSFSLPTKAKLISLLVGIFLSTQMYVLLGAIAAIPVALAVLIFYTYPILIAAIKWFRGEEKFYWGSFSLMIIAFGGLIFVLIHTPPSQITATGITLSIIAALVMSVMLTTSEYNLTRHDNQVVLFYALIMSVFIFTFNSVVFVELLWPQAQTGWLVFMGSSIFYVAATFTLFKAVSLIGPLRTAIIDNTAPVWAMIFGYLLLSQSLTNQQIYGAFLVVVAVMLLQLTGSKVKST